MTNLNSPGIQNVYVTTLIDIYQHWNDYPNTARRKILFDGAISQALQSCGLPKPKLQWDANGGSFNWLDWSLTADLGLLNLDINAVSVRDWINMAVYQYHEARHLEQNWLMVLGMLSGAVAIPMGARGKDVLPANSSVQVRADTLNKQHGFPQTILLKAVPLRQSFQQGWIPVVRTWVDSVFGRGSRARGQTLNHLRHLGHKSMSPYIQLPEEADAWATERTIKDRFRQRIGVIQRDEALSGISSLFNES